VVTCQNISRAWCAGSVLNVKPPAIEFAVDFPFSVPDTVFYSPFSILNGCEQSPRSINDNIAVSRGRERHHRKIDRPLKHFHQTLNQLRWFKV